MAPQKAPCRNFSGRAKSSVGPLRTMRMLSTGTPSSTTRRRASSGMLMAIFVLLDAGQATTEHEVDGAEDAERRPEVVELQRLFQVIDRERHEHDERDDFLDQLELPDREHGVADAIARHLQHVLEERDAPAHERGDDPGPLVELFQMRVPRERHEDVAAREQEDSETDVAHVLELPGFATARSIARRLRGPRSR